MAAKRRLRVCLWFAAGVLAASLGAYLVVWLTPDGSQITMANYERIEPGMAVPKIRSVLGPEGDYSGALDRTWTDVVRNRMAAPQSGEAPAHMWCGERVSIGVWTDESGTVEHIAC